MNTGKYEYDAFISYRHLPLDKTIAEKLQVLLESYKPPKNGVYSRTNRIKRIFRDQSELQTSGNLGADIKKALKQSAFLIVVCSEKTAESRWCLEEIEYFKSLHEGKCSKILTVLVNGEPNKVFPGSLRYEICEAVSPEGEVIENRVDIEPLAANVTAETMKKRLRLLKSEFLRIAAPILGCGYDDLVRRHHKRIVRRTIQLAVVSLTVVISASIYIFNNQQRINAMNRIADEQRILAESERTMRTLNVAEELIGSGNKVLASELICELLEGSPEQSEYTKSEIERLLSQSTYIPQYTQYAVLQSDEEVTEAIFMDAHRLLTATKRGTITLWDTNNGAMLRQLDAGATVLAMLWEQDTLYAVTQAEVVIVWDSVSWEKVDEFSFDDGRTNLALNEISDIMLSGGKLYIREVTYGYNVTAIDLSKREAVQIYQYDPGLWINFADCYFDSERGAIIAIEYGSDKSIMVYYTYTDEIHYIPYNEPYGYFCYNAANGEIILIYSDFNYINDNEFLRFEIFPISGEAKRTVIWNLSESLYRFYLDYCYSAEVSPNGSYLSLGDYYGNIIVIELYSGLLVNGYNAAYPKISQITYVDEDYIFVSFYDSQAESGMYFYSSSSAVQKSIPGSSNLDSCMINNERTVMAVIGADGTVSLFSLEDAEIEELSFTMPPEIKGTNDSAFDFGETDGFYRVSEKFSGRAYYVKTDSVDSGGSYALIDLSSEGMPDYIAGMGKGDFSSYWIADHRTGELIYNANMPMDFIAVDIKDDTVATLLTASYYIHDVDMRTGEILSSIKLSSPFKGDRLATITKFGVNYETDKILLAISYHNFEGGAQSKGIVCSKATGKMLFEFSDFFGLRLLGFDKRATRIYKFDLSDSKTSEDETSWGNLDLGVTDKAVSHLEIEIPDYERLVEIAHRQTDGRVISESEKDILGL